MNRRRSAIAAALLSAVLLQARPALAQSTPNADAVLARACMGKKNATIGAADILEAMLVEQRISPADFNGPRQITPISEIIDGQAVVTRISVGGIEFPVGTPLSAIEDQLLVQRMRQLVAAGFGDLPQDLRDLLTDNSYRLALVGGVLNVEQRLTQGSENVAVQNPSGEAILLLAEQPTWRLTCKTGERPVYAIIRPSAPQPFAVRATPEDLWLTGDGVRTAAAFNLGFERTRTILEDGTRKTETSFSIAGTAGYRISRESSSWGHAYLFASYDLQRDRTRPRPTLGPGESESDGDTDALAVGVDALVQTWGQVPIDFDFQASTVFDFANDARRLRFRAIATPGFAARRREDQRPRSGPNLGLCHLGSFTPGPLRRRCVIAAEVEAAHILRRGTSEIGDYDTFLAIGGRASFEAFLPTSGEDTGFLASVRYRLLPVIHGGPDDIERLEARLSHRFWTATGAGLDVGFTYTRGTNELSFEDEDVLTFGLGLVY